MKQTSPTPTRRLPATIKAALLATMMAGFATAASAQALRVGLAEDPDVAGPAPGPHVRRPHRLHRAM